MGKPDTDGYRSHTAVADERTFGWCKKRTGSPRARDATLERGLNVALTWIRTHDWDAEEWRDRAACRDTTPELFFPIGTTGGALDQIEAARRVCGQCPVTTECLEFALGTNQESGVWGGLTEEERRRLRKGSEAAEAQVG